ncbi:MAG: hypothetical protein CSA15_06335 [Candidatus Delongbacteria bacterium]|nr:MAG: hypothetical protein CSA15_06335 [Candidatus Delongbacteria bacterium]
MKKVLLFLLVGIFLVSCEKEKDKQNEKKFTVYKNRSTPTNPNFNYELTEEIAIPYIVEDDTTGKRNFEAPSCVVTDDEGNIYIAGAKTAKIYKFSKDYKFITSFGGKGKGPGEFSGGPSSIVYHNGELFAPCYQTTNTNVYKTNGEFVKLIPPTLSAAFSGQKSFGKNLLMNIEGREAKKNEVVVSSSIAVLGSDYETISKTIYTKETETRNRCLRISDMYVRYTTSKDILYIGDVSKDYYRIYGYDKSFNKVMEIRKDYKSEQEVGENASVYMFGKSLGGGFYPKKKTPLKERKLYYKSINNIYLDGNNRLWVVSPTKNITAKSGLYVDIFEKGIYLNTIHLPFYKSRDFSFIYTPLFISGDKLFYIDNENEVIRVFSYKAVGV